MNGRIYDGLLGRFLSADLIVQDPTSLQSFNRYSYVFNNPLSLIDPSGYKTISQYEEELEKVRARLRELWDQKEKGEISPWQYLKSAFPLGQERGRIEGAIEDITRTANAMSDLAGAAIDPRLIDDVDPDYREVKGVLDKIAWVPGSSTSKEIVKGHYGDAALEFGKEVGLTLLGGRLLKWLKGPGAAAEGKAATAVAEQTAITAEKTVAAAEASAATEVRSTLTKVGENTWESSGGLRYSGLDPQGLNRVQHVLKHTIADPSKPVHSVFSVARSEVTGLVDEAWNSAARTAIPNNPGAFVTPMGRVVGTAGENALKIVVRPGTNEVVTAFPVKWP